MDALFIASALWVVVWSYGLEWRNDYGTAILWAVGLFIFFGHFSDLYHSSRGLTLQREFGRLIVGWTAVVMTLLLLAYSLKTSHEFSRRAFLTWFAITPLILIIWRGWMRIILGELRQRGFNSRNVAIIGARDLGAYLARTLLDSPWMGMRPVGFYDDRRPAGTRPLVREPLEVVGNLDALVRHARDGKVDSVYITLPMSAEKRIKTLLARLSDTTVSVHLIPDFFIFDLLHSSWGTLGDIPTVSISDTPFYGVDGLTKRVEDILLASIILVLVTVPLVAIAIGVKLSSPGPIFFKQHRYGLRGNRIEVWKFRSMTVCENNEDNIVQAKKNDARVTPFGAFLRRTSLDELPQLINVLQGTMSLVGPRPHAVMHNEQYRKLIDRYMLRHKVKPGITGWAQVNGWRGETDSLDKMQKRVEYDLAYIHNWSLWLDVKILFLTAFRAFNDPNAY
ncbi:MAG: undecaprenyl-phosphate glucose phosphotransferase [Gammaproteobacteria bacterium]|nr:undecaprenyl-phosphate glucose phosphotransferase [Gammaproteobacteria bacterium]